MQKHKESPQGKKQPKTGGGQRQSGWTFDRVRTAEPKQQTRQVGQGKVQQRAGQQRRLKGDSRMSRSSRKKARRDEKPESKSTRKITSKTVKGQLSQDHQKYLFTVQIDYYNYNEQPQDRTHRKIK